MAQKGGSRKLPNGLTQKENKFVETIVEQVAEGKQVNGTQAALKAYDTESPTVAGAIAAENFQKPHIRERVEAAMSGAGLTPELIMNNLKRIASKEPVKWTDATVLKANIEAAKLYGMYPDKKTAHLRVNMKGKLSDLGYSEATELLKQSHGESKGFMSDADMS